MDRRLQSICFLVLGALLWTLALPLRAKSFQLLDNIEENATYTTVSTAYGDAAIRFTCDSGPYRIDSVVLPLSKTGNDVENLTLSLYEDFVNEPVAVPLAVFTTDISELPDSQSNIKFRAVDPPTLEATKKYWLVLSSDSEILWHRSTHVNAGTGNYVGFYRQDNDDWYLQSYLSGITVAAAYVDVYEPSYRATNYIITLDGEFYDDGAWNGSQNELNLSLFEDELPPGKYQLSVVVLYSDGFISAPITHDFYVEPDERGKVYQSDTSPILNLVDEEGHVVASYNLAQGEDESSYEAYISAVHLKNLSDDTTFRAVLSDEEIESETVTNLTNSVALYRQETYILWIDRMMHTYSNPYNDGDEDGLPNILEWYLRTDPTEPNSGVAPTIKTVPDGIQISWVGRGGGTLNSSGQMYFEDQSQHFGTEYTAGTLRSSGWEDGFPYVFDELDGKVEREALPNGEERIRVTLTKNHPYLLNEIPLFIRWSQ